MVAINKIIQRLSILHESQDEELNNIMDKFFAHAVRVYGPRKVVEQVPLQWKVYESQVQGTDDEISGFRGEFTNPWLLMVLR